MNCDFVESSIQTRVRDLRPVFFEDEVRAVVQVVAFVAERLSLLERYSDQLAGFVQVVCLDEFNVFAAGTVAILALIAEQVS